MDGKKSKKKFREKSKSKLAFDLGNYLDTSGLNRKLVAYRKGEIIFSQSDVCESVHYIQSGSVKISVTSSAGKEAVVAILNREISLVRDA
jgi:CRP/FNR family transcriptional regulator, cyclic AMP receptor protein